MPDFEPVDHRGELVDHQLLRLRSRMKPSLFIDSEAWPLASFHATPPPRTFAGSPPTLFYGEFSLKTWNWTVLKAGGCWCRLLPVCCEQSDTPIANQNPWLMCFLFLNNCRGDSFGISSGCNELVLRCVSADKKTSGIKKNDMDWQLKKWSFGIFLPANSIIFWSFCLNAPCKVRNDSTNFGDCGVLSEMMQEDVTGSHEVS